MSAPLRLSLASPKINQFIRPPSSFDVVTAAQRLASSGKQFAAAPEYSKAISRGKAGKLMDALADALGDATVMSTENTCDIADLYTSNECTHRVPPSTTKAGGDKAAGSQAASIEQDSSKKGTLSSSEDETSNDVSPLGEGEGTKPTDNELLAEQGTIFTESAGKRR